MIQIICKKLCILPVANCFVFLIFFLHKSIYCYALKKNDLYLTRVGLICKGTGRTWWFQEICIFICFMTWYYFVFCTHSFIWYFFTFLGHFARSLFLSSFSFLCLVSFFPLKRRRNLPSPVHDELPLAVEEGADWPCCLAPCWCWLWWWWGGGGGYNYEEGINGGDNENAVRGVNKYTFRGKNENMLSVMIFLPYYFPHNHSFQTSQRWPVTLQPDHWYLESPLLHQLLSLSKAILQPVHYYSWKNSFPIFVSYFSKKVFLIFSNQLLSFSKPSHGTSWFSFKEEPPQHHDKSEAIPAWVGGSSPVIIVWSCYDMEENTTIWQHVRMYVMMRE